MGLAGAWGSIWSTTPSGCRRCARVRACACMCEYMYMYAHSHPALSLNHHLPPKKTNTAELYRLDLLTLPPPPPSPTPALDPPESPPLPVVGEIVGGESSLPPAVGAGDGDGRRQRWLQEEQSEVRGWGLEWREGRGLNTHLHQFISFIHYTRIHTGVDDDDGGLRRERRAPRGRFLHLNLYTYVYVMLKHTIPLPPPLQHPPTHSPTHSPAPNTQTPTKHTNTHKKNTHTQRVLREDLFLPLLLAALLLLGAHAFATDARRMIISPLVRTRLHVILYSCVHFHACTRVCVNAPSSSYHQYHQHPQHTTNNTTKPRYRQDRIIAMVQKLALDPLADPEEGDTTSAATSTTGSGGGGPPGGGAYCANMIIAPISSVFRFLLSTPHFIIHTRSGGEEEGRGRGRGGGLRAVRDDGHREEHREDHTCVCVLGSGIVCYALCVALYRSVFLLTPASIHEYLPSYARPRPPQASCAWASASRAPTSSRRHVPSRVHNTLSPSFLTIWSVRVPHTPKTHNRTLTSATPPPCSTPCCRGSA